MMKFEQEWTKKLQKEIRLANNRRRERLEKKLIGEKKMFEEVLWPVFQTFDDFTFEHEIKSTSNVYIYIDAFYHPLKLAFESEGFIPHAENINRDRFSFERMRVRTFALHNYKYIPFTWDELDKQSDDCQRFLYEILGKYTGSHDPSIRDLSVYEREVIRYGLRIQRPFRLQEICQCLRLSETTSRNILRKMIKKDLVRPSGQGKQIIRLYELTERVKDYIL